MNPYIIYEIAGLNGLSISSEFKTFSVTGQGNIDSIEMLVEDLTIWGVKVFFDPDTVIDKQLADNAYQIVSLYLAEVIGELDGVINGLSIKSGEIFNPNLPKKDGPILINDIILMTDSLSVVANYPIERYGQLFAKIPTDESKKDKLLLFINIMKINNIAVRYLMQYEYLMSLVSPKHTQKEVTDFIRDQFNPSRPFNKVGFQTTRRPQKTYDEDDITYYRNILAHNDSSVLPENLEQIVSTMNRAIKEVIFFKLNQMS